MEGGALGSDYEALVIWGLIALTWLGLTLLVVKALRRARGGARVFLFFLGWAMVAVLTAPVWFYVVLFLITLRSTAIEGPVGAGGPALGGAVVLALITGIWTARVMGKQPSSDRRLA